MDRDIRVMTLPAAAATHRQPTFPARATRIDNTARDSVPDTSSAAAFHA
ncbi:hypothetical protein AB0D94_32730 [Streptomyces sp. NPDC048255]